MSHRDAGKNSIKKTKTWFLNNKKIIKLFKEIIIIILIINILYYIIN